MKRILLGIIGALILLLVLFDVTLNVRWQMPGRDSRPDPAQEARYTACVEEMERRFHEETFETVDNPDVQRELLYRQSQEAQASCREEFPERIIDVDVPLDINLVDLRWRY